MHKSLQHTESPVLKTGFLCLYSALQWFKIGTGQDRSKQAYFCLANVIADARNTSGQTLKV